MKADEAWGWSERGAARVWAAAPVRETLLDAFESGALDPAADAPPAGRGSVARLTLAGTPVVARRYRRGGFFGRIFGGLGLDAARAVREVGLTRRAFDAGLSVPEPVAVIVRRNGGALDLRLVTKEIPAAESSEAPLGRAAGEERGRMLAAIAVALRKAHDSGLVHTDLNLGNVLVGPPPDRRISLVDLDRARWREGGASENERFDGLARLARSGEKVLRLPAEETLLALIAVYASDSAPLRQTLTGRLPGWRRRMTLHRLGWALSGARTRTVS